ncbi:MAG: diaminopimelate decarboxylase [Deltaproteobacteria bacterium]|nr:diaminopimelate decarboxylase [Deltaproteobacteria bacterium]NIS76397.1 diaminopimelate decarboxylase [Deltaproteobacteria bacterium]
MDFFEYKRNRLYCEDIPVSKIVRDVGTPAYIYSLATLRRHFDVFDRAFDDVPHFVCYSVKANSNISIIKVFADMGGGVDIVSGGELYRSLKAGVKPSKIVYSGVGKKDWEIVLSLEKKILMFNVESWDELKNINAIAARMKVKAPVALRVNPDVDPKTHPYIATGLRQSKFGIDIDESLKLYKRAKKLKNIEIIGIDCHIGSQLTDVTPFVATVEIIAGFAKKLGKAGIDIRYIDIGGGLGITYRDERPPDPAEYAGAILSAIGDLGVTLILEPGRVLTGNAGILVTEVLYTKETREKNFFIVDAAMNDLQRPSLYGSYHEIVPLARGDRKTTVADVVGPICESGDFLARDREMPALRRGDLLAVFSSGAYGFVMASNYNSRPKAVEVLVDGASYEVIRERETLKDIVRGERISSFLKGR